MLHRLLAGLGIEKERLRLEWVSASEAATWVRLTAEMTEQVRRLGPLGWQNHREG
jgi:F420-non-reducing hydrogenase iron-sulfur subunit